MKKSIVALIIFLLAATSVSAATAIWTGRQEQVQTVTYQWAWKCEYNYLGQTFWRIFQTSCPSSIEVQ
jgi:heme/copper-type cytochrome/quinol oxidase subunit 2